MQRLLLVTMCVALCTPLFAETAAENEAAIRAGMQAQVDAWNRGDVGAFMQTYEDSAETTFIGFTVRKGYQQILKRYQESYTTREEMGMLTFSELDVRLLPNGCGETEIALVTGKYHLQRDKRGEAKKDDGVFSLVWRKGQQGWKIVLDHTS